MIDGMSVTLKVVMLLFCKGGGSYFQKLKYVYFIQIKVLFDSLCSRETCNGSMPSPAFRVRV
jgi:hypothetical protein